MPKTHIELIVAGLIVFTAGIISGFSIMGSGVPEADFSAVAASQVQPTLSTEERLINALDSADPKQQLQTTDDLLAAPQSE